MHKLFMTLVVAAASAAGGIAGAAEIKVLTAGAFKPVVGPRLPPSSARPDTG